MFSVPGGLGDTQFSFRLRQSGGQRTAHYEDGGEYNREAPLTLQVSGIPSRRWSAALNPKYPLDLCSAPKHCFSLPREQSEEKALSTGTSFHVNPCRVLC